MQRSTARSTELIGCESVAFNATIPNITPESVQQPSQDCMKIAFGKVSFTMRVGLYIFALVIASSIAAPTHAQYPDKAVRIVVPVAAGGGVDVMARLLAQKLSERLGQQFLVENRAGAAGIIGSKSVIAALQ